MVAVHRYRVEAKPGVNPCCCWNIKEGSMTIAIWSLVYALASLVMFGWQFQVLNDCWPVVMAQSNLQCQYWCPCVGASTARTSAMIEGLFVIQILCLIAAFFLLCASLALLYGVHTYSRYLIWPWFPCMIASILCSLAYCIMWWSGDVRDYWIVLTILEIISVFINIYCMVVVVMFYRHVVEERNYWEEKVKQGYDLTGGKQPVVMEVEQYPGQHGYINNYNDQERWPAYAYYEQEPGSLPHKRDLDGDLTATWVKDQQKQGLVISEHAASEPPSPTKEATVVTMLPHALSVPSVRAESHRGDHHHRHEQHRHRHRRHRSGSRHRPRHHHSSSRHSVSRSYSSDSLSSDYTDDTGHSQRRRSGGHHKSRDKFSDTGTEESSDTRRHHHHHHKHRHHHRDHHRPRGLRQVKREHRDRSAPAQTNTETDPTWTGNNGITIPQHIIIPPSRGTLGPDGRSQPQKYQINSEITISYDPNQRTNTAGEQRHLPPLGTTSV